MPPKNAKKKAEEQKKKIIEDKTFGLKNKKKSKKVQQYVETVKKQAHQKVDGPKKRSGGAGASSAASSARMAQMAARLAELELMNQPVKAKEKKLSPEELERKRREEEEEAERIRIANLPVEDQIEEERAKLKTRTPVTLELFLAWKEEKNKERLAKLEAEKTVSSKKASKADRSRLQGLTGRELFQQNADIFVDDEEADTGALKASNDYIGSEDESEEGGPSEPAETESHEQGDDSSAQMTEAVGVGDESLFT